jgi:phosphatidylglycerophosphatase GEP4
MFSPTYYFKNLKQIPWEKLKEMKIKLILLDKDNTITKHKENEIMDKQTMEKINSMFEVMVVSNHEGSKKDLNFKKAKEMEKLLGIEIWKHGGKKPFLPIPPHSHSSEEVMVVGDRILTDILFANRNNLKSILVDPISTREEEIGIKFLRFFENIFKKFIKK